MTKEYTCIHEEEFQTHSRKIAELETKAAYKEEMIKDLKKDMKELNDKMDKLSEDVNNAIQKSILGDNDIDKRVTSIETELALQKQKRQDDHDSTMRRIASWGVVLTIVTLLINILFNVIK